MLLKHTKCSSAVLVGIWAILTIIRSSVLRVFLRKHTNSNVTIECIGRKGDEVLYEAMREVCFSFFFTMSLKAEVDQKNICCLVNGICLAQQQLYWFDLVVHGFLLLGGEKTGPSVAQLITSWVRYHLSLSGDIQLDNSDLGVCLVS